MKLFLASSLDQTISQLDKKDKQAKQAKSAFYWQCGGCL